MYTPENVILHIIILIDAEKSFDKVQHAYIIKVLKTLGLDGAYLQIMKAVFSTFSASDYALSIVLLVFSHLISQEALTVTMIL